MVIAVPALAFLAGAALIGYASHTGTRRNLDTLRRSGWGLLISRGDRRTHWRTEGFERVCLDPGTWGDHRAARSFDEDEFESFLQWAERNSVIPDFLVLPDIVAGGIASLNLSKRYMNRCAAVSPLLLIAVQDGMTPDDLAPLVGPRVGIFLGGSTKWKLESAILWGRFCAALNLYYHFARANTFKRLALAQAAGAHSIDGSSLSRYSVNMPKLNNGLRQRDLFSERAAA